MPTDEAIVIRFTRGCLVGVTQRLGEGETTLGRSKCNDVVIDDIMVSRTHLRLTLSGMDLAIEDIRSKGGTFVNGQRIFDQVLLHLGDKIALGNQEAEILAAQEMLTPAP